MDRDHDHLIMTYRVGKKWGASVDQVPVRKKGGEAMLFRHEVDAFEAADLSAWCMDQVAEPTNSLIGEAK